MTLTKKFALATTLVAGMTASSGALAVTWGDTDKSALDYNEDGVRITQILDQNFVYSLPNGVHKLDIDGKKLGTDTDVTCLLIKGQNPNPYRNYGYAGLSCNWPKPKAP